MSKCQRALRPWPFREMQTNIEMYMINTQTHKKVVQTAQLGPVAFVSPHLPNSPSYFLTGSVFSLSVLPGDQLPIGEWIIEANTDLH